MHGFFWHLDSNRSDKKTHFKENINSLPPFTSGSQGKKKKRERRKELWVIQLSLKLEN